MAVLYHGSDALFDVVEPLGVNMGAIGEKPRWSAYYWRVRSLATQWAVFQVIRRTTDVKTLYHVPTGRAIVNVMDAQKVHDAVVGKKAYLYICTVPDSEIGFGSSDEIDEYTVDFAVAPDKVIEFEIDERMVTQLVAYFTDAEIKQYQKDHEDGKYRYFRGKEFEGVLEPGRDDKRAKLQKEIEAGNVNPGDDISNYAPLSDHFVPREHHLYPGFYVSPVYPYFAANREGLLINVKTGRMSKGSRDDRGYFRAAIWDNETKTKKDVKVHRVVCTAFYGPPPGDNYEVGHGNDIRSDNRAENLSWVTRLDNMRRANTRRKEANAERAQSLTLQWAT